jgi:hypothetical protein
MVAPVTVSEKDLRTLLGIVSDNRDDVPAADCRHHCSLT